MSEQYPGRSEASRMYRTFKKLGVPEMTCPLDEQSTEHMALHRAEHYAKIGVLVNRTVATTLERRSSRPSLGLIDNEGVPVKTCDSVSAMRRRMLSTLFQDATELRESVDYSAAAASLRHLHEINSARFNNVSLNISAGIETAVNNMEALYDNMLKLGLERAAIRDSWRVLNDIARMSIFEMLALRDEYLESPDRNPLDVSNGKVSISEATTLTLTSSLRERPRHTSYDDQIRPKIGCPITFEPSLVRELWQWYADLRVELFK